MLQLWSKNGGYYSHIHTERPLREDVAKVIRQLQTEGRDFSVHCWDSDYEGYCSCMGIIDDETLEEIIVHYDHGQAFGSRHWWIDVHGDWKEEFPNCGYQIETVKGYTISFDD